MADALRERLEALADEVSRMVHAFGDEDRREAVRSIASRIRALAAPADVPPLPSGWTIDGDTGQYVGPAGDYVCFYDDGGFGLDGYNVSLAELQALISHHLARHGGGT